MYHRHSLAIKDESGQERCERERLEFLYNKMASFCTGCLIVGIEVKKNEGISAEKTGKKKSP